MDFFTGTGILSPDQVDGSYTGDPSLFIADEGAAAQQGFGSAEPYLYENELTDWGKPVEYEYINDAGWENYAESIATKPENIEALSACFTKLVPIIQQASIDYLNEPARANEVILAAVAAFGDGLRVDLLRGRRRLRCGHDARGRAHRQRSRRHRGQLRPRPCQCTDRARRARSTRPRAHRRRTV